MGFENKTFRTSLLILAFLLLTDVGAGPYVSAKQAQQAKSKCPVTKVTCSDSAQAEQSLTFTADVRGGDSSVTPTYNWTVSAGTIQSGQGTSTIDVSTAGLERDSTVTATVAVGGFDRECGYGAVAASCTTMILKKPEARKLDEYGNVTPKEEDARLDNFMLELNQDPTAQAYIVAYSARTSPAGAAQKAANRAKDCLAKKRGLEAKRVVTIDGGQREQPSIELWIVPSGAEPPEATPTIKRTRPTSPSEAASSQAANEIAAISSLRTIAHAQIIYSVSKGRGKFTDLATLGKERLIDSQLASGEKQGYLFTSKPILTRVSRGMFDTTARPKSTGTSGTGNRSFYSNETLVVYEAAGGEPPVATASNRVPKIGSPIR